MNSEDILSGKAGLAGIQWALSGRSSRTLLRSEAQSMLRQGYRAGPFHLTRAKYKPGRKLSAYFTFSTFDTKGRAAHPVHMAVAWEKDLDGANHVDGRGRLQEEANQSGLMPVQNELWRDLSDQGIELQLWPLDPQFPQLVRLGDPTYSASLLLSLGIAPEMKQMPVVTPIRYRPGERHVLRYEVNPSGSLPGKGKRVYAKLYTNPQDAARAFRIANRVVDWLDANPCGLQGNRPEALGEEDRVIFYPHASGIPLSHLLDRSHPHWLASQLETIGGALAVLHSGPETLQSELKHNTFNDEVKTVKRACEHIQALIPNTYQKILALLDKAQESYSSSPQEEPTFTHSDFKADHFLTTPQGLTLIDFDTCTLTDPAMDIGKFLADLDWWFALKDIPGVKKAQAELFKGYLRGETPDHTMQARFARARLFHTLILVKIAARRVPLFESNWAAMTDQMVARAAQVFSLAHGD